MMTTITSHPTWTVLQDLIAQYLPSILSQPLSRFPVLSTVLVIVLCSTVFNKFQRIRSLPFRVISRAYGLYELFIHKLSFSPIGFSSKSYNSSRSQDECHISNRDSPKVIRRYKQILNPASHPKQYYPGLINSSSNSCFINAVLQSLASMPHIIKYLELIQSYDLPFTPVSNALVAILVELNTTRDHPVVLKTYSVAQALLGNPNARRSMLFNSEQQDAQEFLVMMIDALEEESKLLTDQLLLEFNSTQIDGLERDQFWIQAREISRSPFRALMAHRIGCGTCGFTSAIRHSFADHFSLNVPPKTTCKLESSLFEYTKLEVLDDYICRKCSLIKTYETLQLKLSLLEIQKSNQDEIELIQKKLVILKSTIDQDPERELPIPINIERVASLNTTKQTMFARPPDSLTFHISRSTGYARGVSFKNHCQVIYPEELILDRYCTTYELNGIATKPISTHDEQHTKLYRYRLVSVVVHFGSHSFGHYITYRRAIQNHHHLHDGNWFRISDENVQLSSIDDALGSNPFLLMYERVFEPGHDDLAGKSLVGRELSWFHI
ncbi:hypothetical protein MJO29_011571 [Puccinia striiformis f. sp. tritici]|nr:hypothetical protein MJO29_011571 [Puccinia striiformis f. sp. tritici]